MLLKDVPQKLIEMLLAIRAQIAIRRIEDGISNSEKSGERLKAVPR